MFYFFSSLSRWFILSELIPIYLLGGGDPLGFPDCGARSHLEHLGGPQHALDPVLVEVGHAAVHELQQDLQVLVPRPIQDHNQLPVEGGVAEELGEVGAAGGEDQAESLEGLP